MQLRPSSLRFPGLLLLLALLATRPVAAQKYRTAAGIRSDGSSYGFTVQQVFLPQATIEGLAMFGTRERTYTVLAQRHFGILGPSLNYYFGAGAHYGYNRESGGFWGYDALVGAEYKIAFTRLVVSFDFKPTVEFGLDDLNRFPTALSLRYILVKQKNAGLFQGIRDKFGKD